MSSSLHFTPTMRRPVVRHNSRTMLACLLVSLGVALCAVRTASKAQAAPASGSTGLTAKQVLQLFDELNDIDRLRSLNALKLTPDELDKMTAAIASAKETYDKRALSLANVALKSIIDEIRDVKLKALKGGGIPDDFNTRAKKASAGIAADYAKLDAQNLAALAPALHDILTSAQVGTAAKLQRDAAAQDGKSTAGTDTQWFNQFVLMVIIDYPRIIPLLKEMRTAATATASPGDSATGAVTKSAPSGNK